MGWWFISGTRKIVGEAVLFWLVLVVHLEGIFSIRAGPLFYNIDVVRSEQVLYFTTLMSIRAGPLFYKIPNKKVLYFTKS